MGAGGLGVAAGTDATGLAAFGASDLAGAFGFETFFTTLAFAGLSFFFFTVIVRLRSPLSFACLFFALFRSRDPALESTNDLLGCLFSDAFDFEQFFFGDPF